MIFLFAKIMMPAYAIDDVHMDGTGISGFLFVYFFSIARKIWHMYGQHTACCQWFHNTLNESFCNSIYEQ